MYLKIQRQAVSVPREGPMEVAFGESKRSMSAALQS